MSKFVLLFLGAAAAAALPGCSGENGNNSAATNSGQGQSIESMGPDGGGNAMGAGMGNGAMDQGMGAGAMGGDTTNSTDASGDLGATGNNSAQPR